MTTARQHLASPAPAGPQAAARGPAASPPRPGEQAAHQPPASGPGPGRAGGPQPGPTARQADELAQAARSVHCPCHARPGVPCGPSGDHLARYLHAAQSGAITRQSLTDVIAGLDVIAPHVLIQPPAERAAHTAGAETADQVIRAQLDAGITADRAEASAESVLAGRSGQPTAVSEAFYRGYGEIAATYTREARELEAGA